MTRAKMVASAIIACNKPSKFSKPDVCARLSFVVDYILNIYDCEKLFSSVVNDGWPGNRVYDHLPRRYEYFDKKFDVDILKDDHFLYIAFTFDPYCYCIIPVMESSVPLFICSAWLKDDLAKVSEIENAIFHQFIIKVSEVRSLRARTGAEREILDFKVPELPENFNKMRVTRTGIASEFFRKIPANTDISKLSQIQLLVNLFCVIYETRLDCIFTNFVYDWSPQMESPRASSRIEFICSERTLLFNLVKIRNHFLILIWNEKQECLRICRFPESVVPILSSTKHENYFDSFRFKHIVRFLRHTIHELPKSVSKSESSTQSSIPIPVVDVYNHAGLWIIMGDYAAEEESVTDVSN